MMSAREALQRLKEGNSRFAADIQTRDVHTCVVKCAGHAQPQAPFAIVLGCSDSRVPAEIVFDQGLGDLFVIRVAGNIVAPSLVGSVEFAATQFGTRLVVVLGHTGCGAVTATIGALRRPADVLSPNVLSIVDYIRPSVEGLLEGDARLAGDELLRQGVRANVRTSAGQLRRGSKVLEDLIRDDGLWVVGAEYSLETGAVDFFDVPAARR